MSERLHQFDLKLLTSSKDVGLRRLRSYAASLGGGAQIYLSYDDLLRNLSTAGLAPERSIVLHDSSIRLTAAQLTELSRRSRLFVLQQQTATDELMPPPSSHLWLAEGFLQCSLGAFFESPIMRMSMAQLVRRERAFQLTALLRWGHAQRMWQPQNRDTLADANLAFVRDLRLTGDGRRVAEMFSHFLQTGATHHGLVHDEVIFGSDGLLLLVAARCRLADSQTVSSLALELRIHDYPVAVVNQTSAKTVEIGALHYPFQPSPFNQEHMVLVCKYKSLAFNASPSEQPSHQETLKKVG